MVVSLLNSRAENMLQLFTTWEERIDNPLILSVPYVKLQASGHNKIPTLCSDPFQGRAWMMGGSGLRKFRDVGKKGKWGHRKRQTENMERDTETTQMLRF